MDALIPSSLTLRLQFPPEIENKFREDYHEKTISTSRLAILLGLLLIAAFGFLDKTTAPLSYPLIWIIRYRIVVPFLGLILVLTFFPRLKTWMQFILASGVLISTLGITAMGALTHSGEAAFSTYYVGVLLTLMAGYTFTRLRFWYATGVGFITIIAYEFTALGIQNVLHVPMGAELFHNNNFFLVSANLIGMFASYFMERYTRLDFLQRRQIEEEKAKSETMLQQEAAEALRASEARFRTVVEISTEGIVLVDSEGRYFYTSPAFERITGFTQAELFGQLFMPQIYPDDLPIVMDAFQGLATGRQTTAATEYRFIRKDGVVRFVSGVGQVLPNGQLVAFVSDITERKQAEDSLRRQNNYLTTLHDTTLDLVHRLDTPGLLKSIVARAANLLDTQEAYVFLVEPDESSLVAETGVGSVFTKRGRFQVQRGEGIGGKVWESGKLLAIDNYQTWEYRMTTPDFDVFQAAVGAPLTSGERVTGVLTLARTANKEPFRADELDFLAQFAHLVSVALDNARLYTAAQTELMERRRTEEAFRAIVEGTASATGNEFFCSLVSHLATALGVNHAFVAETIGEPPTRVRTLAFYSQGGIVPNIEYALSNTPCEDVVAGAISYYPQNVRSQFPQDSDLVKLSAESYMGLPIVDASGKVLGHVAVLDNLPMRDDDRRQNILKIFAARAGAELERQHAEAKLRASEEYYRSLIENSSDGIAIFDRQGTIQYVSPGLTRIVGWEADELLGRAWHDFAHPDDLANARNVFHQLFEQPGHVIIHESRFRHQDGSWRVMEVVGKLHPNGRVVTNSRDITERKLVEQKLRESEEHFRSLIENASDGIATVNEEGLFTYVSPGYERIWGWTAEELLSTSFAALIHPDDISLSLENFANIFQQPGEVFKAEIRVKHKEGSWRVVDGTGKLLPNGELVSNTRDVTERRQAEEKLRQLNEELEQHVEERTAEVKRLAAIIETTSDLVGIGNLQGQGVYINRAGRKMLGLDETEDITQTRFIDYYAEHSQPAVLEGIEVVLRGESWLYELSMRHRDGHEIPVSQVSFMLYNTNGQPEYLTAIVRDTSAQKRVEAELKAAKESAESALAESKRLAAIIEAMPDYVGIADLQGNSLYVNRAGRRLVGTPEKDNGPWNVAQCYPSDHSDQLQPMFTAMQQGEPWSGELDLQHLDGHCIPTDHVIFPLHAANGQIESYAAIIRDITERKQAEAALRESEERFRTIAQASPIPILISRINDGTILFANPSLSNLIRVSLDEVVGQKTPNFYYDPTDRARILNELKNKGFVRDFEFRGMRADQTDFWAAITIQPLLYDGEQVMLAGVYEITELKQIQLELQQAKEAAEAALTESKRLSTIIEATSDMVATADLQGNLTYLNGAGRELAGLDEAVDIHRFQLTDFYPPEALPIIQERIGHNIAQGLDADLFETVIQRWDQREVPVSIVGIIHRTPEGSPESLSAVVRDISQQKRAEAELKQAKEAAETANKAKSTFLANMSHEIRTPMNAVIGMTSLLLETSLNVKQRDFVETIRSSGDVLLTIINDILDFSKIEAGKLELVNRPLDLRNSIETTLDLLAPRIAEKNLNVTYYMEADVPNAIQGDSTRLRQILVNLVGNAVKFTEKGEIIIRVDALLLKAGQNDMPLNYELHFQVHDTGIGIPADNQDRLFQSFSQVDASSTRVYGGTGLGLTISKRLAEMMGGVMWMESTGVPGEGSTFHFTMEAEEASLPALKVSRGYVAELTGKKILLVDDHHTNLQILQLQTEAWGMMPQTASSAEEALALLNEGHRFDIAILDSQMPGLNGFELAKKIRDREAGRGVETKRMPLILLASVLDSDADSANLFDSLLTKPVKPSNLFDVLMTAFDANDSAHTQYPKNDKESLTNVELMASQYPLRILLAEDVVVNQKFALLALERMGYRADVVANGQEAMEAILRQPYDVVLMDINMPIMDGYEASRRIHELWKNGSRPFDIPRPWIIAMTANALQGDRELALEAGADDYISKPVYLNELHMVLARAGHERKNQSGGVMSTSQNGDAKLNQIYLQGLLNLPDGKSLIEAYLEESPTMIEQLRQAVQNQSARELKDAAHALKGSSLYVGAEGVAELAKTLENAGRANTLDGTEHVLTDLEKAYSKVAAALSNILNS